MKSYTETVIARLEETARNYQALTSQAADISRIGHVIADRMQQGGMAMFCGNGGSAADAQHLAAELQGRFLHDRKPMSSVALTTNSSILTAIGNDYGYDEVFDRQVTGLGRPVDIVVGLSTSGNSRNVIRAIEVAKTMGIYTLGLTGEGGGAMADLCDDCIRVPSGHTARIQEMHIAIGHMICEIIEERLM